MTIRLASKTDKASVISLLNELGSTGNKMSKNADSVQIGKIFDEVILRKDVFIFIVEDKAKPVALATFYLIPYIRHGSYRGHIEDFVVSRDFRNKGIGTMLFNKIKDFCKQSGIYVIKLTSMIDNKTAHGFYEKVGGRFTEKMFRFDINKPITT